MRYLHTLKVHYVLVHTVHTASQQQPLGPRTRQTRRVAICYKLTLAFTEASRVPALQIEHI